MIGSITDVLRTAFIWLDDKIYGFIDMLYNLFTMLGEATIFTADQIESFASKLYVLISIIMFFRLSFAFVTYIVNPDSLSDKQKGGGALIKKIVITMALLVSVPTIFNEAFYVQNLILKNDIINKVLLGDSTTQTETANRSKSLSTYAFLTFFTPTQKIAECQNYQGVAISDSCVSAINNADNASSNNSNANPGTAYKAALQNYDLKLISEAELVNRKGLNVSVGSNNFFKTDDYYLFDYNFLISTAVGLGIAWILLGFCLDLAVRVVKLGFLEIIAPIPIILSLTPTQKNNTLGNWGRECLSTWASLFIRLMVISFALNLVVIVNTSGIFSTITGGTNQFSMVTIFVVIGILLFAKEFPKLLEDILGLKGAGKMTFNAFKKMGSVPLVGGAITAGATMGGALGLAAGRGLWGATKTLGTSLGVGLGSGIAGGFKNRKEEGGFGAGFKDSFKSSFGNRFESGLNDTGNRMKTRYDAGKSSAEEKMKSAGLMGTDKLGGSMHKYYQENYQSKDYDKTMSEIKKGDSLLERANRYAAKEGGSKYDIYSSREFSDYVKQMDDAKTRRDTMSGEYEKMKMSYESGENVSYRKNDGKIVYGAEAVNEARVDSLKASSDYDKSKASFDKMKIRYKNDAERYVAFTAAEDRAKASDNISKYVKEQEADSKSIQNRFGTAGGGRNEQLQNAIVDAINQGFANMNKQDVSGVPVSQTSNGEYRTPSGIVLPESAINSIGSQGPVQKPLTNNQPPVQTVPQSMSTPKNNTSPANPVVGRVQNPQNRNGNNNQ